MSTEVHLDGLRLALAPGPEVGGSEEFPSFDPVLITAADRPDVPTLPPLIDPAADHVSPEIAPRRADVDAKHERLVAFLDEHDYEGVVFTRADSIAWLTAGGDLGADLGSDRSAIAVFVNRTTRAVLADNVQGARVFEEELAGLGFQFKERPWYQDPSKLVCELTHHKRVASDGHLPDLTCEADTLRALRNPLTTLERQHLRNLGRTLALALEATCRSFEPGATEAEVAAQLAHRLLREGVTPVELRVAADDRPARYRQPRFKAAEIRKGATITATGRRHGLCASASRTVAFGKVEPARRSAHTLAQMVDATYMYFSRPGERVSEIYRRARRIYEKFGAAHEWTLDYQGSLVGYTPRDYPLLPDDPFALAAQTALCWSPSVGAARSGDTIVIDDRGFEVVTQAPNWPKADIAVKGYEIPRPAILER